MLLSSGVRTDLLFMHVAGMSTKIWRMATFPQSDKLIMQFVTLGKSVTHHRVSQNVPEEHGFCLDIGPDTSDHYPGTGGNIEKICSHKS